MKYMFDVIIKKLHYVIALYRFIAMDQGNVMKLPSSDKSLATLLPIGQRKNVYLITINEYLPNTELISLWHYSE